MREFITIGTENYVYGEIGGRFYLGIDNYFTKVLVETDTLDEIHEYIKLLKEKAKVAETERNLRHRDIAYLGCVKL